MAKKTKEERNGENVDGEEPNFNDPEDFVDDIDDQGAYQAANSSENGDFYVLFPASQWIILWFSAKVQFQSTAWHKQ